MSKNIVLCQVLLMTINWIFLCFLCCKYCKYCCIFNEAGSFLDVLDVINLLQGVVQAKDAQDLVIPMHKGEAELYLRQAIELPACA